MDPLSISAGVAGLATLAAEVSSILIEYGRKVRDAPRIVQDLITELETTSHSLKELQAFLEANEISLSPESALEGALAKCRQILQQLSVSSKRMASHGMAAMFERAKWPKGEKHLQEAVEVLRRCVSSFQFALTIEGCKLLSQDVKVAEQSLKLQQESIAKVAELSASITIMKGLPDEVARISNNMQDIMLLLSDSHVEPSSIAEIKDDLKKLTFKAQDEEEAAILDWISPAAQSQKHRQVAQRRLPGTGQWLLDNPNFQVWQNNDSAQNLCCTGGPGVGKSTLASLVIDHLETSKSSHDAVIYYYLDYQKPDAQIFEVVIASLLRQLVAQMPAVPNWLLDFYGLYKHDNLTSLPLQIIDVLDKAVVSFRRCFLVLDAMDECENTASRRRLLDTIAKTGDANLQTIIFSRPACLDVEQALRPETTILISAQDSDVEAYCSSTIASNDYLSGLMDDRLKTRCANVISSHAQGMFLLAILQMQSILESMTKAEVRKKLGGLTSDLGQAFEQTFLRIEKQSNSRKLVAIRALNWILYSRRPLNELELSHALATDTDDQFFDPEALLQPRMIVDSCLGLIQIDHDSKQVRLVHLSLQEYLYHHPSLLGSREDAEIYITKTLLTYLTFGNEVEGGQGAEETEDLLCSSFVAYAGFNWGYHASVQLPRCTKEALMYLQKEKSSHCLGRFLDSSPYDMTHRRDRYLPVAITRFPNKGTGLHIAAVFGLASLITPLLEQGVDIEERDARGDTALHVAAANGHEDFTLRLLENHAKVDSRSFLTYTACYEAVANSHTSVVRQLLLHGAAAEVFCDENWTPLHKAADNGDLEIVQLLLDHGASFRTVSNRRLMPLHRASGKGHVAVIKLLLEKGSSVDYPTMDGWTPLHGASSSGQALACKALIEYRANVNKASRDGRLPIHRACRRGYSSTVRLLLDNKSSVLTRDEHGDTPLHRAAKGGFFHNFDLLLDHSDATRVDQLRLRNANGRTPRAEALYQGHYYAARLLRARESDYGLAIDDEQNLFEIAISNNNEEQLRWLVEDKIRTGKAIPTAFEGMSMLHQALLLHHEEIVLYLLDESTLDFIPETDNGWSFLHCAANSKCDRLVQVLIDRGADVNAHAHNKQTPLHKACRVASVECARALIHAGADIEAADLGGWRPLHTAAGGGSQLIVEELLNAGADLKAPTNLMRTVEMCALQAGHHALAQYLKVVRVEAAPVERFGSRAAPFNWIRKRAVMEDVGEECEGCGKTLSRKDAKFCRACRRNLKQEGVSLGQMRQPPSRQLLFRRGSGVLKQDHSE